MKCHKCGREAVYEGYDPYIAEIFPEDIEEDSEEWWCDECYQQQLDDI